MSAILTFVLALSIVSANNNSVALYKEALTGTAVCSSADALAHDFTVSVSTDTPTKGENVTTTFDFTLDAPVTGGTAHYAATLNGFPYTSSAPLCDEVAKSGDPCPLAAGHHHQESVSAASTTGKIVLTITWTSDSGQEILCAQVTTKTA
jgi:hypothetical protein